MASYVALSNTGTNFNDQNIINVGDIALDTISSDGGTIVIGDGDDAITLNPTAAVRFSDKNILNVGDVSLDSISSAAGTNIAVTLGTDAGDDFIVATDALVVEGDNKNVGIGTAAPGGKLEVVSGNDGDGTIAVRSGNATQYSKISMGTNANKATIGCPGASDTFFTGAAQGDLVLRADDNNNKVHIGAGTSGPAGMVVTEVSNVGRVGVGTSSPTVPLEVQDTTASSATQGGNLRLSSNDGAAMASGHRLGVLEFAGAEDAGGSITVGARIEALCDNGWSASENGADLLFYTTDGNASQSEQMRILADGKVGVGVADPDAHLELFSTAKQLKLSYDASNEASFTVDSGGGLAIVPSGGDATLTGTLNVSAGIEVTTKTAVAGASGSASTAASSSSNTRSGTLTITMAGGHTWSSGANAMTVVLNNSAIDADSVVVVSSKMANTIFHVSSIADNSCKLHASANNSGGDIAPSGTFAINFLVM
jgi:hypothetical protein